MADIGGIGPAIGIGWAVAILCFLLSLYAAGKGKARGSAGLALAGVMAAVALALYNHDVINLPQICGMLILGAAAGWLIGRVAASASFGAVQAGLIGLAGVGAVCAAAAMWRNPHAFGLLDQSGDVMASAAATLLTLQIGFGIMALAGAVAAVWPRSDAGRGFPALMLTLLFLGTAMAGARGGGAGVLAVSGGLAILAGCWSVRWARAGGGAAVMLMLASLAGWSAAASGFLTGIIPLVFAGGLAGSAGLVMALRLCRGVGRKRLADAGRGP